MKLQTLFAGTCLLALGCADYAEEDLGRQAPDQPFAMTIEGLGTFEGRAEYEVSEPSADYLPTPELRLSGTRAGTDERVSLRLGQRSPGAIDGRYAFPDRDHAFQVEIHGKRYEGRIGEVVVDVSGKLSGDFHLESADLDSGEPLMLEGTFSAGLLYLNCNRLVEGDGKGAAAPGGSSPGQATDGHDVTWTPDAQLESAFCAAMRDELGALYGG